MIVVKPEFLSLFLATNTKIARKLAQERVSFWIISHHSESWHVVLALIDFVLSQHIALCNRERGKL